MGLWDEQTCQCQLDKSAHTSHEQTCICSVRMSRLVNVNLTSLLMHLIWGASRAVSRGGLMLVWENKQRHSHDRWSPLIVPHTILVSNIFWNPRQMFTSNFQNRTLVKFLHLASPCTVTWNLCRVFCLPGPSGIGTTCISDSQPAKVAKMHLILNKRCQNAPGKRNLWWFLDQRQAASPQGGEKPSWQKNIGDQKLWLQQRLGPGFQINGVGSVVAARGTEGTVRGTWVESKHWKFSLQDHNSSYDFLFCKYYKITIYPWWLSLRQLFQNHNLSSLSLSLTHLSGEPEHGILVACMFMKNM